MYTPNTPINNLTIKKLVFNPFEENTYIVSTPNGESIIIDPGCSNSIEEKTLTDYIQDNNLNVKYLINTHYHIDHVIGNFFVKKEYPKCIHLFPKREKDLLMNADSLIPNDIIGKYVYTTPDDYLVETSQVSLMKYIFEIKEVPGHSPGHIILIEKKEKLIFSGDTLFRESIGRGDLPGGNTELLIRQIKEEILPLDQSIHEGILSPSSPPEFTIYPGHGQNTTLSHERENNPFINT